MKNFDYAPFLRWIVVVAIPLFLALVTVRLLINWDWPSYPAFEYGRIAPDRYGFSAEERLELAEVNLVFLRKPEPADEAIHLLEELRLPGTDEPLFNEGELSHMADVKRLADIFKVLGWILTVVVVGGLIVLMARPDTRLQGFRTLFHGGLLTTSILLAVGLLILVSWDFVFTQFHEILFPPGTWQFAYTDSLIRLFPEQFWFDFGLIWAGAVFVEGLLLSVVGYLFVRND